MYASFFLRSYSYSTKVLKNTKKKYFGDIGDSVCPALKTERSRNERDFERAGATELKAWAGGIIWSSGVKLGIL